MIRTNIKTYSELILLPTFEERYEYLKLNGVVAEETFGYDRYLNQVFYKSKEWLAVRDYVIIRDHGCDLGVLDRKIWGRIIVHHMNPLDRDDIIYKTDFLLNPEYLISVSKNTHEAINYGNDNLIVTAPIIRQRNDTCPWRR